MRLYKNEYLNIRINPILKRKFQIAMGFESLSGIITRFMQDYVRDYEKQYGILNVSTSADERYDLVTKMFGVKILPSEVDEFLNKYSKSKTGFQPHRVNIDPETDRL